MSTFRSGETEQFWRYIAGSLDRLMGMVETLPNATLSWRPAAAGTNSILVLAGHTLGNAADNILGTLASGDLARDRDAEFVELSPDELTLRWRTLRLDLEQALQALPDERLSGLVSHPRRGPIAGREVLIVVARHAAEHLGQAELTRDLALA